MKALLKRMRQRWWGRVLLDAVLLLSVVTVMGWWQTRAHLRGVEAPAPTLVSLDGSPVALASFRGQPVMLAFWAPWCTVCKAESQNLSWVMRLAGNQAHVVSVVSGFDDVTQVQRYVTERGVDYPVLLGSEELTRAFHVEAFPTVYFLDAEGRVKHSVVGYTTALGLMGRLFL